MDPIVSGVSSQVPLNEAIPSEWFQVPTAEGIPAHGDPLTVRSELQESGLMQDVHAIVEASGGTSNPMALLAAQTKLIEVEMTWLFASQVTSKVSSGLQTLFNNQV